MVLNPMYDMERPKTDPVDTEGFEVGGSTATVYLYRTSIFEWYSVRCESWIGHSKEWLRSLACTYERTPKQHVSC